MKSEYWNLPAAEAAEWMAGHPPGTRCSDGDEADERTADIDDGLNHVGPDDCRQAAFKRIDQRQCSDDGDRRDFARAERDRYHDRNGVDAHAFRGSASQQKKSGGQRAQSASEAAFDEFVGGVEIAAKVMGQKQKADDDAADYSIP